MAEKRMDWAAWILKSASSPIRFEKVSRQDYEKESKTCIEYFDEKTGQFLIEKHLTEDIFSIVHPHGDHPGSKSRG